MWLILNRIAQFFSYTRTLALNKLNLVFIYLFFKPNLYGILQGRINDVYEKKNRRFKTGTDKTTCQGRTRLAGYQTGLPRGDSEM